MLLFQNISIEQRFGVNHGVEVRVAAIILEFSLYKRHDRVEPLHAVDYFKLLHGLVSFSKKNQRYRKAFDERINEVPLLFYGPNELALIASVDDQAPVYVIVISSLDCFPSYG
jgi:hypothetical protein